MRLDRRRLVGGIAGGVAALAVPWSRAGIADETEPAYPPVTNLAELDALAAMLAEKPFEPPPLVAERFLNLDYDRYWRIAIRPEARLWADAGSFLTVGLVHAGFLFRHPVAMFEIADGTARAIPFSAGRFTYDVPPPSAEEAAQLGYAGFKLFHALSPDRDLAVFQGSSYFRAVGRELQYGLSARGLAIDTSRFGEEEFPMFRAHWLQRPAAESSALTVLSLLDSASTTGAYRFVIRPGATTVMDVEAIIHPRTALGGVGVAPITSMYFHGENDYRQRDDFRPEVHDSDGLAMLTGHGEWLWRPLVNPAAPRVATFQDENPRGFGLLQRDDRFDHYQDIGARYDRRPHLWVEPVGDWGRGALELVELTAEDEGLDNVVAYWRPEAAPQPGAPMRVAYRLHWGRQMPDRLPAPARTMATRIGRAPPMEAQGARRIVVDFTGGDLPMLAPDAGIEPVVSASAGRIEGVVGRFVPQSGVWQATFDLIPEGAAPIDLRLFLRRSGVALTETWTLRWHPDDL